MDSRQRSWSRVWLMTDERMGEGLWAAIERLPAGSGVVFRHYSLAFADREALAERVSAAARKRGLTLAIAADADLAKRLGADLVHNPAGRPGELPFSRAVHSVEQAEDAAREGAALVFVSPVYVTRSHPDAEPLGVDRAVEIAQVVGVPAIALGGMSAANFAPLERAGFYGWAGIDAWLHA
jgi:thiamine-phosphate pyrophosphorylase